MSRVESFGMWKAHVLAELLQRGAAPLKPGTKYKRFFASFIGKAVSARWVRSNSANRGASGVCLDLTLAKGAWLQSLPPQRGVSPNLQLLGEGGRLGDSFGFHQPSHSVDTFRTMLEDSRRRVSAFKHRKVGFWRQVQFIVPEIARFASKQRPPSSPRVVDDFVRIGDRSIP